MKIGEVQLKSRYTLAPMADFGDFAFRSLCADFGCGLTCSEMISAKGLWYQNEGSKALLVHEENESPRAVQIFSREPEIVRDILQRGLLEDWDILDINMGCPVPKVVREGMGSALMLEPKLAGEIIQTAVLNSKKPVTVKFRLGFDNNHLNAVDFAQMCEANGASAICVHGRTRTQMYTGQADWDSIGKVVAAVKIPVIGNGDITSKKQADQLLEKYSCAAVSIGRAALGRPWIFSEMKGEDLDIDKAQVIRRHFEILQKYMQPEQALLHMRKHLASYVNSVPNARQVRQKLVTGTNLEEILNLVDTVFKK